MTAKELKKLIDVDIDKAFDELDEIFEDDGDYNDLTKEYIRPPNNFNIGNFRSRLKRFVQMNKEFLSVMNKDKTHSQNNHAYDQTYKILCNLDFTRQVKYFNDLVQSTKVVIPFVIRAEQNHGQRWLYNRLIYQYQEKRQIHPPIVIDLENSKFNLKELIDYLVANMGIKKYDDGEDIGVRRYELRNILLEKIKTAPQILVFKNAVSFIHSDEFNSFFEVMNYLFDKLNQPNHHKCIFLFIENTPNPYKHTNHCILSSKTIAFKAKQETLLKIIDLENIQALTKKCIEDWLGTVNEDVLQCFNYDEKAIEQLLVRCGNGHPEQVIPFICEKIGKNYKEHEHLWLKY